MPKLQDDALRNIREKIQDRAVELFVRQGYNGTTTRAIATAAGLSPGALYVHYASKEALYGAIVERHRGRMLSPSAPNPLRAQLDRTKFPYDMGDLAWAIRDLVRENKTYWLLWYIDVVEFEGANFKSQLAPRALLAHPALKARLEELRERKLLRLPPELAFTMAYMHLFNYFLVETILGGSAHYGVDEKRAVAAIADVFCGGMLTEKGHRESKR